MHKDKTQVAIIGGGPAGLLLSQLLHMQGVDSVILERQTREYVLSRIRAGVLEQGTATMLREASVHERMEREGQIHEGVEIVCGERRLRIDLAALTGGKTVIIFGQTEITRDLYAARDAMGGTIFHEVENVQPHAIDTDAPYVSFNHDGEACRLDCEFIAGCDGSHGVSRTAFPSGGLKEYERIYDLGWLGVLSETKPAAPELIYAGSERGFALCSMRNERLSRYYIQCNADESAGAWSDDDFWNELRRRLPGDVAASMETGPSIEKSVAPLRSYVAEPLRCGRLFLAGDAGHIVPPTGAKGLNLAVSDIHFLARGLIAHYCDNDDKPLARYSDKALARVWKTERFSWWMTMLLHNFSNATGFERRLQQAEIEYLFSSRAAQTVLAENYVGLPYE